VDQTGSRKWLVVLFPEKSNELLNFTVDVELLAITALFYKGLFSVE
jgi:hypothetical protein